MSGELMRRLSSPGAVAKVSKDSLAAIQSAAEESLVIREEMGYAAAIGMHAMTLKMTVDSMRRTVAGGDETLNMMLATTEMTTLQQIDALQRSYRTR